MLKKVAMEVMLCEGEIVEGFTGENFSLISFKKNNYTGLGKKPIS